MRSVWRHRFENQARRGGLPQNVTDALLGHLNPMNESEGYGRGFRFVPDATAPWVEKIAAPLPWRPDRATPAVTLRCAIADTQVLDVPPMSQRPSLQRGLSGRRCASSRGGTRIGLQTRRMLSGLMVRSWWGADLPG